MGQKSNTTTLKKSFKNFEFLNLNSKQFFIIAQFKTFFDRLLFQKNILVLNSVWNLQSNVLYINLHVFFCLLKTKIYKKKNSFIKTKQKQNFDFLINSKISSLFSKQLKFLKINSVILDFKVLNILIHTDLLVHLYYENRRFLNVLFARRFNLFIDFLKISSLFLQKEIDSKQFLIVLGRIFRILPKRTHVRFIFFLKNLFEIFINNKFNSNIIGLKFIINGKLRGKTRSDSKCIQVGQISLQTLDKNIKFSRIHVYTLYGTFGFKFYVCYNK
jgi:hypothetical protein